MRAMRPHRLAAALGAVAAVGASSAMLFQCAEPTQIVVDVRTDGCRLIKSTGIAVTTWSGVDQAPLTTFKNAENGTACEAEDRIGTLTVYPSGDDKEGEVGIRIVAGVDKLATECAPPWDGCVVARRRVKFIPGTSQQLIVIVSLNCKGKDCGLGSDCTPRGECVALPGEEPTDAGGGGSPDACASCSGIGQSCNAGVCTIDCSMVNCQNAICPDPLECTYRCPTARSCENANCRSTRACRIECLVQDSCRRAACNAPRCDIDCSANRACEEVALGGEDAGLTCRDVGGGGDPCRGRAFCDAGRCTLSCDPNANGGQDNGTCPNDPRCDPSPSTECLPPW